MNRLRTKQGMIVLSAATSVLVIAGLGFAQATRAPQATGPAPPTQGGARENLDVYLAEPVALENDNEIALAKVAETRAENKDVVKFAEMMVKDHEKVAKDLEKFAGNIGARRERRSGKESDSDRDRSGKESERDKGAARNNGARTDGAAASDGANTRRPAAGAQAQPGAVAQPGRAPANAQHGHVGSVLLQIDEQLAEECLESAQRELHDKKGAEFDHCYMGMQIGAHMKMVDMLKVYEKHATPELAQVFRKGREAAQGHLDQAKKIMKNLDGVRTAGREKEKQ